MVRRKGERSPEAAGRERRVLDVSALAELQRLFAGGERPLLGDVLGVGPQRLADMRDGLGQRDPDALCWAAEALRGGAKLVGARRLSDLCARLADAARRCVWDDARVLIEALDAEYARVRSRLERELRRERSA